MSDELIEEVARALFFRGDTVDETQWEHMQEMHRTVSREQARAALSVLAPALLEKGVRLGLEAAASHVEAYPTLDYAIGMAMKETASCIRAIDPAAIARSEP
jgi:hypothetical protein